MANEPSRKRGGRTEGEELKPPSPPSDTGRKWEGGGRDRRGGMASREEGKGKEKAEVGREKKTEAVTITGVPLNRVFL